MKSYLFPALVSLLMFFPTAHGQNIPNKSWQIETATMAVPEDFKEGAQVYGYSEKGDFVILRKGNNQYICIADDPEKEGFSVAAYQKDLEPFMARGRALKAEGKDFDTIFKIREQEVKEGKLSIPDKATLFVLTGEVDASTGQINNPYLRYVVYMPFATGESTGLPTKPGQAGHPWLMDAGTYRAHIMISPPKKE